MKHKKPKGFMYEDHIDGEWISSKIDGHGGSYGFSSTKGLVTIGYIGHKNRLQVLGYNIILYLKYLKRNIKLKLKL